MKAEAKRLATMVSDSRVREIAKELGCTPRQCRQHLLAGAGLTIESAKRVIGLIRGTERTE